MLPDSGYVAGVVSQRQVFGIQPLLAVLLKLNHPSVDGREQRIELVFKTPS